MIRIEKDKSYDIRFMPNIHKVSDSILELKSTGKNAKHIISKYFSYALAEDGSIDHIMFGRLIKEYIHNCIHGFYGTSDGYFICKDNKLDDNDNIIIPKFYYANSDKSIISIDEDRHGSDIEFTKHDDVIFYNLINIFDVKGKYNIVFNTRETHGFLEIYNLGLKEVDPLYKDGDDKNKITSLYDHKDKLDVFIEQYKLELIEKYPDYGFIFGDDAHKAYWDRKSSEYSRL